jgi:DNA-binding MarR family transcriptional regulator
MPNPSTALDKPKPDYSRLTRDELNSLISLHRAGKTLTEIAAALKCSVPTVHDWVHKLTDTTDVAKLTIRASASELTDRLIAKAKPQDILEVLDRIGVIEKRQQESGKSGVTVLVGGQDAQVQVHIGGESASIQPAHNLSTMQRDAQVIDTQAVE